MRPPSLQQMALRLYVALLGLFPAREYRDLRANMADAASQLLEREYRSSGAVGLVATWVRLTVDACGELLRVHWRLRPVRPLQSAVHSARLSLCAVRRSPGYFVTTASVLAIAVVGVTVTTAILDVTAFARLPYRDSAQLVVIWGTNVERGIVRGTTSYLDHLDLKAIDVLVDAAATGGQGAVLTGRNPVVPILLGTATPNAFALAGPQVLAGRLPSPDAYDPTSLVLGEALARRLFGSVAAAVGQALSIDSRPFVVEGVVDAAFQMPPDLVNQVAREAWVQMAPVTTGRGRRNVWTFARLNDAVRLDQAGTALATVGQQLAVVHPVSNASFSLRPESVRRARVGDVQPLVVAVTGAACLLLILACANVANLVLVRAVGRRTELGVRVALGASRGRLALEQMVEVGWIVSAGVAAGLTLGYWLTRWLASSVPENLASFEPVHGVRSLLQAACLCGVAGAVSAGWPAIRTILTRTGGVSTGARSSQSRSSLRLARGLVAAQIAASVALLAGATLLGRTMHTLLSRAPGFEVSGLVAAQIVLPPQHFATPAARQPIFASAVERVAALPGVNAVALTNFLPLSGADTADAFDVEGHVAPPEAPLQAGFRAVSHDYFDVMGIAVVDGRPLTSREVATSEHVALVNQAMARWLWPGQHAVGHRIRRAGNDSPWFDIVGVVADVRHGGARSTPQPEWFMPYTLDPYPLKSLIVSSPVAATLAPMVTRELAHVHPQLRIERVRTLEDYFDSDIREPRFQLIAVGSFAVAAVALAFAGIAGVSSHVLALRRRELAVRMALGEPPSSVGLRIVRSTGLMAGVGIVVGLVAGRALGAGMASALFGIEPGDPVAFGIAAVCGGVAAVAGTVKSAWEAARTDPVRVLKG